MKTMENGQVVDKYIRPTDTHLDTIKRNWDNIVFEQGECNRCAKALK
jgi:hypothetical protein